MELAGENGSILELKEGHPLVLGRVAGLSHFDGSVSRHQVVVELLRPSSRKGKEIVGQSLGLKLQLQVVGRNPICVLNRGSEGKGKPKVKFLCSGQKDWLVSGDQISLSIKQPFFYELRFEGRSSPNCAKANSDGVGSTPDRKSGRDSRFTPVDEEEGIPEAVARRTKAKTYGVNNTPVTKSGKDARYAPMDEEEGIAQAAARHRGLNTNGTESSPDRNDNEAKAKAPTDEEAGIAEAVARRQRRRLERQEPTRSSSYKQQNQAENAGARTEGKTEQLGNEGTKVASHAQQSERKAVTRRVENSEQAISPQRGMRPVDPVTEFGFLVEGSEFSAYEKKLKANQCVWRSDIGQNKEKFDSLSEDEPVTSARGGNRESFAVRKSRDSDEEEEWGGDTQGEHDLLKKVAKMKGRRGVATRETRPRNPSSKRANSRVPSVKPSKRTREQSDEESDDDDDSSGSLADFIVDDEDPIEEDDREDEQDVGFSKKRGESKKPVCQYGSKCYRKNPDHRAQFYHPSA